MKNENQNESKYNSALMTFLDYYSLTIIIVASVLFGLIIKEEGMIFTKIILGLLVVRRLGYLERRIHILGKLERRIFKIDD